VLGEEQSRPVQRLVGFVEDPGERLEHVGQDLEPDTSVLVLV